METRTRTAAASISAVKLRAGLGFGFGGFSCETAGAGGVAAGTGAGAGAVWAVPGARSSPRPQPAMQIAQHVRSNVVAFMEVGRVGQLKSSQITVRLAGGLKGMT